MRKFIIVILLLYWSLVIGHWSFAYAFPQRIVSGMPSVTEMLYVLDLGDRIVGVTTNCNYPPEAKKKEKVGGFFLNLEKIVSLKPDLIVMIEDAQRRDIEKLKGYGLPVLTINPKSVREVMDYILKLGEVTGKKRKAESVVAAMRRRIGFSEPKGLNLETILKRPKVLAVIGSQPLVVAGGGSFIDDIMQYAGVNNLAGKSRLAYPQFSYEQLLNTNPDYIIVAKGVMSEQDIYNDPNWRQLAAVKEKRVLFIDADILSRPGPRVVDAIQIIAKFTHGR